MKINVSYNKSRYIIDVLSTDNIYKVKQKIQTAAQVTTSVKVPIYERKPQTVLLLNGSSLLDNMTISDIGLMSGSTLQYKQVDTEICVLKIYVRFMKKTIELGEVINIETSTMGDVRVLLQNKLGIPISMFYIIQPENPHRELYDIHGLAYYGIKEGDILNLQIWKGTRRVIIGAINADISTTMTNIPNFHDNPTLNRYLLRVTLFIAGHFDHKKLAAQVLQRGIRCEEPVGEHSSRQWCSTQSHPDVFKTPIHQVAHQGSFNCLKMFIRHSPSSLICRDGHNMTPSNYASKYKNIDCWKLLIASQFMHDRIYGFTLHSHSRIMKWCATAKDRVNYFKGDTKRSLLLHSTVGRFNNTYLGNAISVDGFNHKQTYIDLSLQKTRLNNNLHKHKIREATPRNIGTSTDNLPILTSVQESHDNIDIAPQEYRNSNTVVVRKHNSTRKLIGGNINIASQKSRDTNTAGNNQSKTTRMVRDDKHSKTLKFENNVDKKSIVSSKIISSNIVSSNKYQMDRRQSMLELDKLPVPEPIKVEKKTPARNTNIKQEIDLIMPLPKPRKILKNNKKSRSNQNNKQMTNVGIITTSSSSTRTISSTTLSKTDNNRNLFFPTNDLIIGATGMNQHDLACACLQLGETFRRKSWIRQFNIALNSSTNRIKRGRPRSQIPKIA